MNADEQACINILELGQQLMEANVEQQFKRFPRISFALAMRVVKFVHLKNNHYVCKTKLKKHG